LRYTYRCVVTAAALLIVYAVSDALRRGEPNSTAWALLVAVGAVALATAIAAWSRHGIAISIQVVAVPALAALYLFEWQRPDPLEEQFHFAEHWRLVKSRKASGQPISIQYSPTNLLDHPGFPMPEGDRVFALAPGAANVPTIMCREGARPFAEYVADEHGFNNPPGVWGNPVDIVLIGDSMVYGACVSNRDHFVAQIRKQYPATLNLGVGGIGPLIELAIMREFVPHIRPKYVFYLYDENNDVYHIFGSGASDLAAEQRNPILRHYLADDRFSQRLFERRSEFHAVFKRYLDSVIEQAIERQSSAKLLLNFLGFPLIRAGLPPIKLGLGTLLLGQASAMEPEIDSIALFKTIISKMIRISNDAGAKFVFVNIPGQPTLCNGLDHPMKKSVLDSVAETGVDMVDLEEDYRSLMKAIGRDSIFAIPPCSGHFSERGYKVIGDRLLKYLHRQGDSGSSAALAAKKGIQTGPAR
jgi:hypothetical protein